MRETVRLVEFGENAFRAVCVRDDKRPTFGGRLVAQVLEAAGRTVAPDRRPHSVHARFLRPGDPAAPVDYDVEREQDGRSFSVRRVVGGQSGRRIVSASVSFHVGDDAAPRRWHPVMPDVIGPEASTPLAVPLLSAFELRVPPQRHHHPELPLRYWARCVDVGDDALSHACALGFLSDFSTAVAYFDDGRHRGAGSLDHALWLHRPVRMDRWVLVDLEPRVVADGRGWYSGTVYAADGDLLATIAQEALFRQASGGYLL